MVKIANRLLATNTTPRPRQYLQGGQIIFQLLMHFCAIGGLAILTAEAWNVECLSSEHMTVLKDIMRYNSCFLTMIVRRRYSMMPSITHHIMTRRS